MPTPASVTINLGGTASGGNPSGLSITGNTPGSQIVNFASGTTSSSPSGFSSPVAGYQNVHFGPSIVAGTDSSGLTPDAPATAGTATIAFSATPAFTPATPLAIAGGVYTFKTNVDGFGPVVHEVTATGSDTMTSMASLLQTAIGGGVTVTATGNSWVVTSGTTGASSSVIAAVPAGLGHNIATFGVITPGSGYIPGTYYNVPLTGGTGNGASADIVVNGDGTVHAGGVTLRSNGTGYTAPTDSLSALVANMGGTGDGFFAVLVATVTASGLDLVGAVDTAKSASYYNTSTPGTNLFVSTYTTTITVDGTHVQSVTVPGTAGTGDTYNHVITAINAELSHAVATFGVITPGSGYTPGVYTNVALTGGTGHGARATITVNGDGTVHAGGVVLTAGGAKYTAPTDSLTAALPGGTLFAVLVATTTTYAIATLTSGDILVTSSTTGPSSTVVMVPGTLFPALTHFSDIDISVPGFGSTAAVTATITVDGTPYPFSVAQNTMTTFAAVVTALQAALNLTSFTGAIAGTVLTASGVTGTLSAGQQVLGTGVAYDTIIRSQLTGTPGAAGTYAVSVSQTVGSEAMTSGIPVIMGSSPITVFSSGSITAGTGYTTGTYYNVPLIYATPPLFDFVGQNAHADITVDGAGHVTVVTMVSREGTAYTDGDVLTALSSDIGGTGSGFSFVLSISTTYSPDIKIISSTGGDLSSVSIFDGTAPLIPPLYAHGSAPLFSAMAGFEEILPAHHGVSKARPYGAYIAIDSSVVSGVVGTLGPLTGGSLYVNGRYTNVPLTGGTGSSATANVTVSGVSHGTATVAFTAPPTVTPLTLVGITAGPYTFKANVDGAGAVLYTINASGFETMAGIAALMTTALAGNGYTVGPGAKVSAVDNKFVIMSPTLGSTSSVVLTIPPGSGTGIFAAIGTALSSAAVFESEVVGINAVTNVVIVSGGTGYTIGQIASLGAIVAGSGGIDSSYTNVPLLGGHGAGATADITVAGGIVTVCTLDLGGLGYTYNTDPTNNDILTASPTNIGGVVGFSIPVATLSSSTLSASNADLGGAGSGFSVPILTTTVSPFSTTVHETGVVDNTFTAVVNGITAALGSVGSAAITGGNIVISTAATGPTATIAVADTGELFSSLTGYVGIVYSGANPAAAVPATYGVGS